jgi:fatty acid-binding protein DegV
VDEGKVVPFERTRTRGKAMQALFDFANEVELAEELAVIHNTTPDDARKLAEMLAPVTPDRDIRITQMGPVLDTHLGAGAMGVVVKVAPNE